MTVAGGTAVVAALIIYSALAYVMWMPRLCYLFAAVASAGIIYCAILWKIGIEEIDLVKRMLRR